MIAEPIMYRLERDGTVSIPAELLERRGFKEGDDVVIAETEQGILVMTRDEMRNRALEEMGRILKEEGVTLDDLVENGRVIREQIAREKYGNYIRE